MEEAIADAFSNGMILGFILALILAVGYYYGLKAAEMRRYRDYYRMITSETRTAIDQELHGISVKLSDMAMNTNTRFFKKMSNAINELQQFIARKL